MKRLDKNNIEDILSLTPMQEGMLFHYLKDPGSDYYFEQLILEISGKIDVEIFEKTWDFVVETNEMLRAVFRWEKVENPVQIILKKHKCKVTFYDLSEKNSSRKKVALEEIKAKDRREGFDLNQFPFRVTLCKIEEKKYEVVISNHHILYDGWSNGIILKEFFNAFNHISSGKELLKPVKTKYKEFVKWMHERGIDGQEKFWRNYLQGFDTQTGLSIKRKKGKEVPITGTGTVQMRLEKETKTGLEDFVKKHKITLASFLYSAWGLLLQKYNNTHDVIFGTTVSGRAVNVQGIEEIVGLFINTVPLRVQTFPYEKTSDLLYQIDSALKTRRVFEQSPLVNIKEYSEIDHQEELFDSIVIIENYPLENLLLVKENKLSADSYSMVELAHYDLSVGIEIFDEIKFVFTYNKELFDDEVIVRLANHFIRIAEDIIENPGKKAVDIEIISEEEKKRILFDFNSTDADYPKEKTIHQLFEEQVEKTPDCTAAVFEESQLTYRGLNEKSNQLARLLRVKGANANKIVGLMPGRSNKMIIGMLAVLKAGGVYVPIGPEYPRERIEYILEECGIEILLTDDNKIPLACTPINLNNTKEDERDTSNLPPINAPTDLMYVIYTSGTTGKPKGVMIEHRSFVNFIKGMTDIIPFTRNDVILSLTTLSFDIMGLETILPLVQGSRVVIGNAEQQLNPCAIALAIGKERITIFQVTPSRLQLIMSHSEAAKNLKLLKYLLVGGEAFPERLLEKTRNIVKGKIYNVYGPTETTVWSTVKDVTGEKSLNIGKPIANTRIYILSRNGFVQPLGIPGELYISGAGVARGYFKKDTLTREKFIDNPLVPGGKMYKTGDLAKWLPDGNIDFLGRIDHQIKIRGFRIELNEIEQQLLGYAEIKDAVVITKDREEDRYLCAYIAADKRLASFESELRDYLSKKLPDYMIPAYFVQLKKFPLTPSGKVNRKALPLPDVRKGAAYVPPGNKLEKRLAAIWSEILRIEKEIIGIENNFFELGGHSLKVIRLISKIHKEFNVEIVLSEISKISTIRALAQYIDRAQKAEYSSIELTEEKDYYELSSAQHRLYLHQQMNPRSTLYNLLDAVVLEEKTDKSILEETLKKLVERHEGMRVSFEIMNDKPVYKIHDHVDARVRYYEQESQPEIEARQLAASIIESFNQPFDLAQAPLFRVGVIREKQGRFILTLCVHHIIADWFSYRIFMKNFVTLLRGRSLPPLKLQYKDFSEWQNRLLRSREIKKQENYWLNLFKGDIPVLNLASDFPRPDVQVSEGRRLFLEIDKTLTGEIRELVLKTGTTLYMTLSAVYSLLLAKYTGQKDILVGTSVAGRRHGDLDDIIGMFVNMLPMRNFVEENKTFEEFLREVKENALHAFENQDYQFEELIAKLGLQGLFSRHPLFDTIFVLQTVSDEEENINFEVIPFELEKRFSHFDISFLGLETRETINVEIEYSKALFKSSTIKKMSDHYMEILKQVVNNHHILIKDITLSSGFREAQSRVEDDDYANFGF